MNQLPLCPFTFNDPDQKLTVIRHRKTRGMESWDYITMTRAEIKANYPSWDGATHILRADYRLGLRVTIKELKANFSRGFFTVSS